MKKENFLIALWRVLYPMLIYFGITLVVSFAFSMVNGFMIQAEFIATGKTMDLAEYTNKLTEKVYELSMMMTFISAVVAIPLMILFYKSDIKKRGQEYDNRPSLLWYIPIIITSVFACISVNSLIGLSNLSKYFPGFNEVSKALYGGDIIWEVLAACIAAPIVEELIFRGLIYNRIRNHMRPIFAMFVSSILFGAYHMNVVQGIYAFIIGMIFVFIYEKYKTIWAPILAHAFANTMSIIITETTFLDKLFQSTIIQLIVTILGLVISICMLYLIQKKVKVNVIEKNSGLYDINGEIR